MAGKTVENTASGLPILVQLNMPEKRKAATLDPKIKNTTVPAETSRKKPKTANQTDSDTVTDEIVARQVSPFF